MVRFHQLTAIVVLCALLFSLPATGLAAKKSAGQKGIKTEELRQWLTYFSSDQFEGRATYSEGFGLAAAYLADQLKSWGVRPGGDNGSYFQRVSVLGVKSINRATITIEAHGETRTFKNSEGFTLPANIGAKRAFSSGDIEFLGYGLEAPMAHHNDFAGKDVRGKVLVFLGPMGPNTLEAKYRRLLPGRVRTATEQKGAVATISPSLRPSGPPAAAGAQQPAQPSGGQGFMSGPPIERADFTTVQRLDLPIPPAVSAQDDFFEFLFKGQQVPYSELKTKASNREPLPAFTLKDVKITFNLDVEYQVVRTQYSRNVVGIVEGKDSRLKKTYIAYGAHYDHMGYSEGEIVQTSSGPRRAEPKGRVKDGALNDRVWNGADDDGSGSIAILAIAKAFALGPKSRRSLLFVFHTGEERGLYGSRYFADYPSVPIDSIVAQVNLDMVGRNRDDKADEANSVYVIGSDRISTKLHNITVDCNQALNKPLKLDFEMNDPADAEQFYYRSDHYSYAVKGIPVVFLTTGLHPDYHANTDSSDKINYEKMTRIGQLAYEIGLRVGNMEHPPARDNRGPRMGAGSTGKLQP